MARRGRRRSLGFRQRSAVSPVRLAGLELGTLSVCERQRALLAGHGAGGAAASSRRADDGPDAGLAEGVARPDRQLRSTPALPWSATMARPDRTAGPVRPAAAALSVGDRPRWNKRRRVLTEAIVSEHYAPCCSYRGAPCSRFGDESGRAARGSRAGSSALAVEPCRERRRSSRPGTSRCDERCDRGSNFIARAAARVDHGRGASLSCAGRWLQLSLWRA